MMAHEAEPTQDPAVIIGSVAKAERWWQSNLNLGFVGTVAAGLVVAALIYVFGQTPQWLVTSWRWLVHPIPVPLVLLAAMIGAVGVLAVGIVQRFRKPAPPPWLNYRADTFLEIIWRWHYDTEHTIVPTSIMAYCPKCDVRLRSDSRGYGRTVTSFSCTECPFQMDFEGGHWAVLARISALIEREVNRRLAPRT